MRFDDPDVPKKRNSVKGFYLHPRPVFPLKDSEVDSYTYALSKNKHKDLLSPDYYSHMYLFPSCFNFNGEVCFDNQLRTSMKLIRQAIHGDSDSPCVYLIGNFYIGATSDLLHRIQNHVNLALSGKGKNKGLNEAIIRSFRNNTFKVRVVDSDIRNEYKIMGDLKNRGYSLTNLKYNCEYLSNKVMSEIKYKDSNRVEW